jgi:hypothetical protein
MVVFHNDIINAIAQARNIRHLLASDILERWQQGQEATQEQTQSLIQLGDWIDFLTDSEQLIVDDCIDSTDVWNIIQKIGEQAIGLDCVGTNYNYNNPPPTPTPNVFNYVESVTGLNTNNADPQNPVVRISVDGTTIIGDGTPASPLVVIGGGGGGVSNVSATAGTGISVTVTNPTTTPNINIVNTAPDQTVVLNAGTGIGVAGTYPNFTISNTGSGGNANIVYITNANLITLGSTSGISTTTFYVVTDAAAGQLLTKGKTSTTIDDGVLNLDTGESGTYVLATDTFTVSTPDLQQVLDAGNVSTTGFRIEDGAGKSIDITHNVIEISNAVGRAKITSPALTTVTEFTIPNKTTSPQTFAMLSDLTSGGVASVNSGININVDNTDPANPIINSLSDRYKTTSGTSNTIGNGSKTFTVDANLSYIPLQEVLVVYNVSNHMHGTVTSYSGTTLIVDIKHHTGSGTYTLWSINLDGTPVDAITGSGTAGQLAEFSSAGIIQAVPLGVYAKTEEAIAYAYIFG